MNKRNQERVERGQRRMALRSELDRIHPVRGSDIGSFLPPKFDSQGNRLSTKVTGMPGLHRNNRNIRRRWKESSDPRLPVLQVPPTPDPEKVERNRGNEKVGKGKGVPCESLRTVCCRNKAIAYGPKRKRLCLGCLKVAWMFQGFCPIQVKRVEVAA